MYTKVLYYVFKGVLLENVNNFYRIFSIKEKGITLCCFLTVMLQNVTSFRFSSVTLDICLFKPTIG